MADDAIRCVHVVILFYKQKRLSKYDTTAVRWQQTRNPPRDQERRIGSVYYSETKASDSPIGPDPACTNNRLGHGR